NHIPQSQTRKSNKNPVSWWNDECSEAIKNREKARNKYRKTKLNKHLEEYKSKKEIARKKIRTHKTNGWIQFTETLNDKSNSKQIWDKIRRIQSKSSPQMPILKDESEKVCASNKEKADLLAKTYSKVNSNNNHSSKFSEHRKNFEKHNKHIINDNTKSDTELNKPFSLQEFNIAIRNKKGSAT
ncbi:hypothetical protein ScPMuIL_007687, partial [Solemya velum]